MVEYTQEDLQAHLVLMRKFCHHPDCKYPMDCPRSNHGPKCSDRLALNTAIMWEASQVAFRVGGKYADLDGEVTRLGTMISIFELHPYEYRLEIIILNALLLLIREIQWNKSRQLPGGYDSSVGDMCNPYSFYRVGTRRVEGV